MFTLDHELQAKQFVFKCRKIETGQNGLQII